MPLSTLIWNELRLMMYLDRCLRTEGERCDHTICTCRLTPQYVDMERTEGWVHARGATYLAGHVSPPSGVVTIGRDPVIACTPTKRHAWLVELLFMGSSHRTSVNTAHDAQDGASVGRVCDVQ